MADTGESLAFDLTLGEIPVTLTDPGSSQPVAYVLRELDGRARDAYLNNLTGRLKTDAKGNSTLKDFTGLQANLLTRSLFHVDGGGGAVTEKEVQAFPARVLVALFNKSKDLSGLDDEAEEAAGND